MIAFIVVTVVIWTVVWFLIGFGFGLREADVAQDDLADILRRSGEFDGKE